MTGRSTQLLFALSKGVTSMTKDRSGGAHTPRPRAVLVLVHVPDRAVGEHLQPHDERHWRLGGTK